MTLSKGRQNRKNGEERRRLLCGALLIFLRMTDSLFLRKDFSGRKNFSAGTARMRGGNVLRQIKHMTAAVCGAV